jgi:hypothetical protein
MAAPEHSRISGGSRSRSATNLLAPIAKADAAALSTQDSDCGWFGG